MSSKRISYSSDHAWPYAVIDNKWEVLAGTYNHFIWDKDNFRLILSLAHPIMTISNHNPKRTGGMIKYESISIKSWEWAA